MLRLGFGLVFAGLAIAAYAAPPVEDFLGSRVDLLTTRFVHSGTETLLPYQFSASVVIPLSPNIAPVGSEFSKPLQLLSVAQPQQETVWAINPHWIQTYDGDGISLSRLFRVDFKEEQVYIALQSKSVLIGGERLKVTFVPHSALIESGRLKIILQPHATSILWSNAF